VALSTGEFGVAIAHDGETSCLCELDGDPVPEGVTAEPIPAWGSPQPMLKNPGTIIVVVIFRALPSCRVPNFGARKFCAGTTTRQHGLHPRPARTPRLMACFAHEVSADV
jgi:hypothetical protein